MKIPSHLTLVRGQGTFRSQPTPGSPPSRPSGPSFQDMLVLVSRENRRAQELHPRSLQEAQRLLERLLLTLREEPVEAVSDSHRLQAPSLIRLL